MQLEIHHDDEKLTTEATSAGISGSGVGTTGQTLSDVCVTKPTSLADELDNLMDISIEIASNKRMKKDYIKPFKLTFKDKEMEKKVCIFKILSTIFFSCMYVHTLASLSLYPLSK